MPASCLSTCSGQQRALQPEHPLSPTSRCWGQPSPAPHSGGEPGGDKEKEGLTVWEVDDVMVIRVWRPRRPKTRTGTHGF